MAQWHDDLDWKSGDLVGLQKSKFCLPAPFHSYKKIILKKFHWEYLKDKLSVNNSLINMSHRSNSSNISSNSSATNVEEAARYDCSLFVFLVCSVAMGIACLLGTSGNALSFFIFTKHKTTTSTILLLKFIAIFDFLFLFLTFFIYPALSFYQCTFKDPDGRAIETFGSYNTRIFWPTATIMHTCIVWSTVLVTVNRYRAVTRAVEDYGSASNLKPTYLHVLCIFIFSIIYNLPRFFETMIEGIFINVRKFFLEMHSLSCLKNEIFIFVFACGKKLQFNLNL
ncbi:hypothetical protein HELRODRAFT_159134 [Helobdella robusta]|uniref:G-protein coupled receptors family 1 profile domain-containing protein n=1 Tax=Helobdella robusta TaxID=6412 RepID=T1ENM7_HELRO|nr:hypothetical protein HELRODRAFT_159134 [Helobdella robusta]ESO12574.1 hypothetical protein HELRODRAFT_159134 [Helobdella robusta]